MSTKTPTAQILEQHLNAYLDPHKIQEKAYNGIQVTNTGAITNIATAVSASLEAIEKAVALKAQALIVHHGIFRQNDSHPLTGITYKKIKLLMEHNIALLCYHLPLDAHQEIGNNWKAARDLELINLKPFAEYNGILIGVVGQLPEKLSFEVFKATAEQYYKRPAQAVKVKDPITSVAIVSGGADGFVAAAAQAGADCFITGRVDEPVWDSAHEHNISFLGLGHYGTETVGVKALADYLPKHFAVSCTFLKTANPF